MMKSKRGREGERENVLCCFVRESNGLSEDAALSSLSVFSPSLSDGLL